MKYFVQKETMYDEELGTYTTYAIAYNHGGLVEKVGDVSCELEKVEGLVCALNLWRVPQDVFSPLIRNWVGG